MENVATSIKNRTKTISPEDQEMKLKNERRLEGKQLERKLYSQAARQKEKAISLLVILGLLGLLTASLLHNSLFLKELIVCSLIIGGVVFIRTLSTSVTDNS